jgi:hypothetical protein
MRDAQVLRDERILRADVVVDGAARERAALVRRRRRLSVSEERGDDDEVFLWVERFIRAYQPEIIGYSCWG